MDINKAIELLHRALRVDCKDPQNHYYLGLAYSFVDGHHEEAIRHVEEAVSLKPDYLRAYSLLAELLAS